MLERSDVFILIDEERVYQDGRWGNPEGDGKRELDSFATYISDYARRLVTAATDGPNVAKLNNLRKIAALCVAAMEQHGGNSRALEEIS